MLTPLSIQNPISVLVLGICSALAVTIQLKPSVVMMFAMTFVLTMSNVIVSLLRTVIPKNIRIIVELTVIASLVILADQFLKAFMFDVSKQLSVFVGLLLQIVSLWDGPRHLPWPIILGYPFGMA